MQLLFYPSASARLAGQCCAVAPCTAGRTGPASIWSSQAPCVLSSLIKVSQQKPHLRPSPAPCTCSSIAAAERSAQQGPTDFDQELAGRLDRAVQSHRLLEPLQQQQLDEAEPEEQKKSSVLARRRGTREPLTDTPLQLLPKVAIVGRPNVGKSALFNRISGSNTAIIYDYPGVTRDRMYMRADWGTTEFVLVDTGGLMSNSERLPPSLAPTDVRGLADSDLPSAIEYQAAAGIDEADTVVLVVDGQSGLVPADADIVSWLRRTHPHKPLLLVVNKCESARSGELQAADFWALGLEPMPVSAISGTGTGDMMDAIVTTLPSPRPREENISLAPAEPIDVAILGRPNVGKSSLLNALVGEQRAIVSSVAGTTRDAIDTDFTTPDGRKFRLIDTAGIRRKGAVASSADGAESLSVQRAVRAVRRCEVVALVLDAVRCVGDDVSRFIVPTQDFRLAELIASEGRAAVIVVNKWDAVAKDAHTLAEYEKELLAQLRPLSWAPVVFTSAFSGQRVSKILEAVVASAEQHRRRISTATLNMVIREAVQWRPPPVPKGSRRRPRIYYATQAAAQPPTFVLFVNDVKLLDDEYKRYLERQLRENAGFDGTPLRIVCRGKPAKGAKEA